MFQVFHVQYVCELRTMWIFLWLGYTTAKKMSKKNHIFHYHRLKYSEIVV